MQAGRPDAVRMRPATPILLGLRFSVKPVSQDTRVWCKRERRRPVQRVPAAARPHQGVGDFWFLAAGRVVWKLRLGTCAQARSIGMRMRHSASTSLSRMNRVGSPILTSSGRVSATRGIHPKGVATPGFGLEGDAVHSESRPPGAKRTGKRPAIPASWPSSSDVRAYPAIRSNPSGPVGRGFSQTCATSWRRRSMTATRLL